MLRIAILSVSLSACCKAGSALRPPSMQPMDDEEGEIPKAVNIDWDAAKAAASRGKRSSEEPVIEEASLNSDNRLIKGELIPDDVPILLGEKSDPEIAKKYLSQHATALNTYAKSKDFEVDDDTLAILNRDGLKKAKQLIDCKTAVKKALKQNLGRKGYESECAAYIQNDQERKTQIDAYASTATTDDTDGSHSDQNPLQKSPKKKKKVKFDLGGSEPGPAVKRKLTPGRKKAKKMKKRERW